MKAKRIFAMLLALCLVVSLVPASVLPVFAAEQGTYTHPVYEKLVEVESASQLNINPSQVNEPMATTYLDEWNAAKAVRKGMEARETDVPVNAFVYATSLEEAVSLVLIGAMEHTGNPTEGDYLSWQLYDFDVSGSYTEGAGNETARWYYMMITYHFVYLTTAEQEAEMDDAVKSLLDELNLYEASPYSKIKGIYDYICTNVKYDVPAADDSNAMMMYTAYNALINKSATAYGMSLLLYRLALELGIDCRVITGTQTSTGYDHVWNIVQLYDEYYNLDVVADSTQSEYAFFLKNNEEFYDHTRAEAYDTADFNSEYNMAQTSFVPYEIGMPSETVIWMYNAETETLTVAGEGAVGDWESCPWTQYVNRIKTAVFGEKISTLNDYILADHLYLEQVTLPTTLQHIGASAFEGCLNLKTISLPEKLLSIGNAAFKNCEILTRIPLPGSLESIGDSAFENCSSMAELTIPEKVASIGTAAFKNCSALTGVHIPESVTSIGAEAFSHCAKLEWIVFPQNMTEIPNRVCISNGSLTSVTLPANLIKLGDGAFAYCGKLAEISLPEGLQTIGGNAFLQAVALVGICIPDSVTEIGNAAFCDCGNLEWIVLPEGLEILPDSLCERNYKLTSVTMPAKLVHIGQWAFRRCTALSAITLPDTLETIGDYAFSECELSAIELPDSLKEIGNNAFFSCPVPVIDIPESVTRIGNSAFGGTDITEIVFPAGITVIPEGVCRFCTKLVSVTIPSGVTELGRGCFSDCDNLTSVTLPETLEIIGDTAFYGSPIKELRIPASVREIGTFAFYAYHADEGLQNVYFTGNAPEIGTRAFENVKCNAYYPQGNETWTEDVMQQYEGTLTWIPYVVEVARGTWGDNLTWVLDSTGKLTISGEGEMYEADDPSEYSWYEYNEQIKQVVIESGVTTVAGRAFSSYRNLEKVVLSEGLTSLGRHAFSSTSKLTEIQLPSTLKIIDADCFLMSGITNVTLPEGLETIGAEAFCFSKLTQIVIPDTVTSIGTDAFGQCTSLTSAVLSAGCAELPMGMFRFCAALETVTIPEGVTTIGWSVFSDCGALKNVTLPESLVSIGVDAFENCTSLTEMEIPAGVTTFENPFRGCTSLSSITFLGDAPVPEGQTAFVDNNGFEGVTATIYYPANNETWTEEVMQQYGGTLTWVAYQSGVCGDDLTWTLKDGVLTISGTGEMYDMSSQENKDKAWHAYIDSVTKVIIETGATSIGKGAFSAHGNLEEVQLPGTLTTIGNDAFGWCFSLKRLEIPEGVTAIPDFMCIDCRALEEVILPEGLVSIGRSAFGRCTGLTKVVFPSTLESIDISGFASCSSLSEMWFTGHAPRHLTMAFDGVTATAYYPRILSTWTAEKIASYETPDTVTWMPYDLELDNPFTDVPENKYFYTPVLWAYYNGITSGKTATTFEPNTTCTRAQVMTFLWAAAGRPEPTSLDNPFTDVSESAYYYKAVLWAVEKGITSGTTATTFSPNASCTRNQVVTFLWVNAGRPEPTIENPFTDVEEGKYYYKAILWAYENGITSGKSATTFEPHSPCTRGQIVTFLYQALANK